MLDSPFIEQSYRRYNITLQPIGDCRDQLINLQAKKAIVLTHLCSIANRFHIVDAPELRSNVVGLEAVLAEVFRRQLVGGDVAEGVHHVFFEGRQVHPRLRKQGKLGVESANCGEDALECKYSNLPGPRLMVEVGRVGL